jgi:hypothetical protein
VKGDYVNVPIGLVKRVFSLSSLGFFRFFWALPLQGCDSVSSSNLFGWHKSARHSSLSVSDPISHQTVLPDVISSHTLASVGFAQRFAQSALEVPPTPLMSPQSR